ncbi:Alpha/Beta hydrolase protein [Mycena rosella]|uniref:Alpha/Beta hydrolase protein n=1 Tax=Mycena rosella TaxID=1033263 RepID=A0AAD7CTX6_MYCRO|nr:Alpha/Beta hydrolase protein [Mycena rosella]
MEARSISPSPPQSSVPPPARRGGPGVNYVYLLILSDLTEAHGIPLVTEQLFLDELDNLLVHPGIQDDYDILGHSWGGMLGSRHAAAQPKGLKHLVLASTPADMGLWNALRTKLPREVQDILDEHEKAGTTESAEHQAAMGVFYGRHLCTIDPMPAPVTEGFGWIRKDPTMPTLLVNGRHDEAQDPVVAPFFREIHSSHMVHFEERERYMQIVGSFLMESRANSSGVRLL